MVPSTTEDPSTSQAPARSTDKPPGQSAISAAANISSDEDEDDPSPAAMEYEDDESGNESFLSDSNDALHLLYDSVAGAKDSLGHLISEPFMRLPSRRVYPDYYEEIENPIALGKIKQRIKVCRIIIIITLFRHTPRITLKVVKLISKGVQTST